MDVCALHVELDRQLASLNRDIGKVAERVAKLEALQEEHGAQLSAIMAQQAQILTMLTKIEDDHAKQRGYIAGLAAGAGAIGYCAVWLFQQFWPKGGGH